jgi:predicted nuclease of predicted toxin-antitoxin system
VSTVRFHLDEHIPSALADALKRRGIDVTTAAEAGLLGLEDERHFEFALQTGRVIVTQDADFLRMHAEGKSHAGIAFCKRGSRSIGQLLQTLLLIHRTMKSDEMKQKVVYL